MCRMYSKFSHLGNSSKLKPHHHIRIDVEFRNDCRIWMTFLRNPVAVSRPMTDFDDQTFTAEQLRFFTDASLNPNLGFGCVFNNHWTFGKWEPGFVLRNKPSICYLELYTLCVGVLTWLHLIKNKRVIVYCDNQATVNIINSSGSKCKNCMYLLRVLMLDNLVNNLRVFAKYINTKKNYLSDALSRMKINKFLIAAGPSVDTKPMPVSSKLWPLSRIWLR